MKALCVQSPNNLVIEERPMPVIELPTQVLIKVKAAGICGSDVHIYHGTSSVATYPRVIGHEIVGEIIEKGNEVKNFSLGDRVIMDPVISCGTCYQCRIGRRNVCGKLKVRWQKFPGFHIYQSPLLINLPLQSFMAAYIWF